MGDTMNAVRTTEANGMLDAAESRRPNELSWNILLRDAEPACGFTGVRSLWFDSAADALSFVAKQLPYLRPTLVEPAGLRTQFLETLQQYERKELSPHSAFESFSKALESATYENEVEDLELVELRTFQDIASNDSPSSIALRNFFRTGELTILSDYDEHNSDEDWEACEAGVDPLRKDEVDEFCNFLVGRGQAAL